MRDGCSSTHLYCTPRRLLFAALFCVWLFEQTDVPTLFDFLACFRTNRNAVAEPEMSKQALEREVRILRQGRSQW